jgi:hypothetical protein
MLTLTGATGIVFVIVNSVKTAFDFNPKWLGLAVSQVIALIGVALSGGAGFDYFVGCINGFLIFSTAAGVSSMGGPAEGSVPRGRDVVDGGVLSAEDLRRGVRPGDQRRRKFWSGWF